MMDEMPAWAIRLEGKVDLAIAQQGSRLDTHAEDIADHEKRLRALEARRTVSPSQLWSTVVSVITVLGGIAATALAILK